ncbi:G-patch domain [Popillia japonica]|uniref:G-patch domain n=1 Tax=Popillia japonica TaxID=7064 RepID=A0AAW1IWN9_POPJA
MVYTSSIATDASFSDQHKYFEDLWAAMNTQKKISFGFSKSSKPTNLLTRKTKEDKKSDVELIECLEGQSIKVKNVVETKIGTPLVIPLRDDSKDLLDRIRQSQQQHARNNVDDKKEVDNRPDCELTLDELAARELLKEATQKTVVQTETTKIHAVPLPTTGSTIKQADNESTLDDYNSIPISDFGMAMLRGMGWTESSGIGKNNQQAAVATVEPELRPKGMGLGADKIIHRQKNLVKTNQQEEDGDLQLIRGGFCKIIAGSNQGKYCEVMSWDDESGRIIVKTTIEQNVLSLNEFLVLPVSKEEYQKNGRILNNVKYEQYKDVNADTHSKVKLTKSEKDKDQASSSGSTVGHSRRRRRGHSDSSSGEESVRRGKRAAERHSRSSEQRSSSKYDDSSSNAYDDRSKDDKSSKDHHRHKKQKRKQHKKHKYKRRSSGVRDRELTEKRNKKRHRSSSKSSSYGYSSSDEFTRKSKSKKKYR